ncbi:MAG: hypothetical protein C4527_06430 [Candidatus Omnitrophota bacterium]|jgi:hypothetical protein|nr:MAG: hypothetical protein C4527_06430 [Candidatus Omnitrophota bacterium]
MKTIDLKDELLQLNDLIDLARKEPVLLLSPDGKEFLISEADNFEKEVETLRASHSFQNFLDIRTASKHRIPLEEIEREIEKELSEKEERSV